MSFLWCTRPQSRVGHTPVSIKDKPDYYYPQMMGPDDCHSQIDFLPEPLHYQLHTVIGRGCNEAVTVSLAKHVPSGQMVAVKRIHLEIFDWDFSLVQNEVLMLRLMSHPNILASLASFVHNNEVWIILPMMAYGSCQDLIQAHFSEGLSEMAIAYILRDVLEALDYLHQRGIIHRGVRASHILIAASGHVCLAGLRDTYSMLHDGRRDGCVHHFPHDYLRSLLWASPEMLQQNLSGYDTKSDIYSLGITACELANGAVPFADMPPTQMLLEKLDSITPQLLDSTTVPELQIEESPGMVQGDSGLGGSTATNSNRDGCITPPYQRTFSEYFHNFVQRCFEFDPKARPTAAALLQHSFFRQIRRRPTTDALPDLLKPVSPLTDIITSIPTEDSSVGSLTQKLTAIEVEEETEEWTF